MRRARKELRKAQERDHREIEEDRRGGRGAEFSRRVQHRRELSDDRDAEEIRERDARQLDGERLLIGSVGEARREHADDLAHEDEREHEQDQLRHELPGEDFVGELRGGRCGAPAVFLGRARVARQEGRAEGAFGEDGAEIVGQAERDHERVGDGTRAENGGHQHVAEESCDARERGEATDRSESTDHADNLRHRELQRVNNPPTPRLRQTSRLADAAPSEHFISSRGLRRGGL